MKNKRLILAALLVILLLIAAVLLVRSRSSNSPSSTVIPAAQQKNQQQNQSSAAAGRSSSSPSTGNSSSSGSQLTAPFGSFVSSHKVAVSGEEESICSTSAGATCEIQFISGSNVKSLAAKTTGDDGSAVWDWTPASIGLTAGTWQIKAVAQLGGQSKTTQDNIPLTVQ